MINLWIVLFGWEEAAAAAVSKNPNCSKDTSMKYIGTYQVEDRPVRSGLTLSQALHRSILSDFVQEREREDKVKGKTRNRKRNNNEDI